MCFFFKSESLVVCLLFLAVAKKGWDTSICRLLIINSTSLRFIAATQQYCSRTWYIVTATMDWLLLNAVGKRHPLQVAIFQNFQCLSWTPVQAVEVSFPPIYPLWVLRHFKVICGVSGTEETASAFVLHVANHERAMYVSKLSHSVHNKRQVIYKLLK